MAICFRKDAVLSAANETVHYDSIGRTGCTDRLAGYKHNFLIRPGPAALDNEPVNQMCELLNIFWDRSAAWYHTIMKAHLTADSLVGA